MLGDNESLIQLSTPPHTITLDEHTFPSVEEANHKSKSHKRNVALSMFEGDDSGQK